jgi:uncharacterized protein YaaN involved in tellurite resistance
MFSAKGMAGEDGSKGDHFITFPAIITTWESVSKDHLPLQNGSEKRWLKTKGRVGYTGALFHRQAVSLMSTDPLDLSKFTALAEPAAAPSSAVTAPVQDQLPAVVSDASLPVELKETVAVTRLVDPASLDAEKLKKAQTLAASIDFTQTQTTLAFVEGTLAPVAQISRKLLADTQVKEMGEVGRVATAVLEGINILRLDDLKKEAQEAAPKATGLMSKLFSVGKVAHSALKSFEANRKQFLALMDKEEARARAVKADLLVTVQLLDQQSQAVRQSISDLTVAIAAGQLALERGQEEAERLRQVALTSQNPGDAAVALDFRRTLLTFQSRVADLRQAMIASATLVPVITLNRQAAETRIAKLTDGLLLTLPRLMTAASQAAVQADLQRAAAEQAKLDEADRKVMALAGEGAHQAAVSATQSLASDPRNIQALATLAEQTQNTMREVLLIEKQVQQSHVEQEQQLVGIRNDLVKGMVAIQAEGLAQPIGKTP